MTPEPGQGGMREEQARLEGVVGDDAMFDMTNLSTQRTGLEGVIHISTAQRQHGPRIKWYLGRPDRDASCPVVTPEPPPRAINQGLPPRVARQAEAELVAWAALNREALLAFWHDGLGWTEEEHDAFLDGLKKLP